MSTIHLLVLMHGMWGNQKHLAAMDETIRAFADDRAQKSSIDGTKLDEPELRVHLAQTNLEEFTYDGIDNCGERVATEIYQEVKKFQEQDLRVTRLSITGYSLGGLIGRYLVGILYRDKFFDDVTPVNFCTFATPHFGLPSYPGFLSKVRNSLGPRLLSRSGEQLFLKDKWSPTGRPLFSVMADSKSIFYEALCLFPNINIYANGVHDSTATYLSSAIETEDPFLHYQTNGIEITYDDDYTCLVKSFTFPDKLPEARPKPRVFSVEWFKRIANSKPMVPPVLQYGFPINILVYMLLPVLIPTFVGLVIIRLSLASRSSRKRIKSMENDESYSLRLVHAVAQLEKEMEDMIVDIVEDAESVPISTTAPVMQQMSSAEKQPTLLDSQKAIAKALNSLPNLKKHISFFDNVMNSHAIIICRDPQKFAFHERGRSILKHWVDNFEV